MKSIEEIKMMQNSVLKSLIALFHERGTWSLANEAWWTSHIKSMSHVDLEKFAEALFK